MESLYRKYRPQTFADVVGQSHVVTTLERAVLEGRTSHAYLFCGPRGTGKTTMARLLAKALMCERGRQQLPDGTCRQCRQIAAGEHPDVYELDAASRTGVDNVREEIINRVGYAPVQAPVKLYIIDEVHMLTTAAFNALLKTLEEPPEHVVFVLCTTDPQKIPQTILSRVQRFDFRPISDADIEQRLAYVCEQEGFTYEQEALRIVSVNARGGMRDALSSLEQLSVFGGGTLSVQAARDLLGSLPEAELDRLVDALAKRDAGTVFTEVQSLSDGGADLLRIVGDLAVRMRDVYVAAVAGKKAATAVARSCDAERLAHDAEAFGTSERIARALGVLSDVSREMATAPDQRLCFEIALTRILRPEVDLTMEALSERVAELEARLARLESTGVAPAAVAVAASPQVASTPSEKTHETGRQKDVPAREDERAPLTDEAPSPRVAAPATRNDAPAHEAPARTVAAAPVPDVPKDMGGAQHGGPTPDARAGRHGKAGDSRTVAGDAAAAPVQAAPKASQAGSAAVTDAGALQRMWKQVSSTMFNRYPARGSLLANARAVSDDGEVLVARLPHGSSFSLRMLDRADVRTLVDNCVRDVFGPRVVRFEEGPAPAAGQGGAGGARMPVQATQQRHAQTASAAAPVAERSAQPLPWDEPAVPAGESMAAGYDEQGPFGDPGDRYLDGYLPFEAQEDLGGGAAVPKEGPAARQAPAASEPAGKEPAKESGAASDKAQPQESEAAQAVTKALADPELTDLPSDLIALLEDAFEVFGSDMQVKLPR